MKKFYSIILLLFFVACAQTGELQKQTIYYGYDFRPYTAKGFLFTTEGYEGQYESIGVLSTVMFPEVKKVEDRSALGNTSLQSGEVFAHEAIDSMYAKARSMGANAIIRFQLLQAEKMNGLNVVKGIEVRGFAIKRVQDN